MPGSVRNAVSVGVLPFSLCTQLTESRAYAIRGNEYSDGTPERMALTASSRRSWKVAKRLAPVALLALRNFLDAHPVDAFYIYALKETAPPFTWDPTGAALPGRYLVRSAGGWNQSTYIPRADCSAEFVEIWGDPAAVPIASAVLSLLTSHIPGAGETAFGVVDAGATNVFFDLSTWALRTDTAALFGADLAALLASTLQIMISVQDTVFADSTPYDELRIYDCWVDVVYVDLTTAVLRPTTTLVIPNSTGAVVNPGNAVDADPTTYASVQRWHFSAFGSSPVLQLGF
ncbi:MAG: hypothetical protein WDO73_02750 [Ignavibacteriota bacterium]